MAEDRSAPRTGMIRNSGIASTTDSPKFRFNASLLATDAPLREECAGEASVLFASFNTLAHSHPLRYRKRLAPAESML